jgi:hypothetical protein
VVIVLLAALVITIWMYRRSVNAQKVQWAKGEALPRIVELVKEGDNIMAFSLAQKVRKYISDDPTLVELWPRISRDYSIITTPAGADIFCRQYTATHEPWQYLGRSPLQKITLPQGAYRWKIEKEGFETHECVDDDSFDIQLSEEGLAGEMVWIGAGTVTVHTSSYAESTTVFD